MSVNIDFRKIVEILEIDAPVHFTPEGELDRRNFVYCSIIGEEEIKAIATGIHNTEIKYNSTDVGLYFPDIDVMKYYDLEEHRNPVAMGIRTKEIIDETKMLLAEMPILFAVYCVVHEYGHWIDFKNSGKTAYEYWRNEQEARKPYSQIQKKIYEMPDNDPLKFLYAERFEREIYSMFPCEVAANNYAKENFVEAVKRIRNSLGYDEESLFTKGFTLFFNC